MKMQLITFLSIIAGLTFTSITKAQTSYVGIPVFIGYTNQPAGTLKEVKNIADFREAFGTAPSNPHIGKRQDVMPVFVLDHALQLFWENGGQNAYILSAGRYQSEGQNPQATDFTRVLRALKNETKATLILMPYIVHFPVPDYIAICQAALSHAATHKQFVMLDIKASSNGDTPSSLSAFRNSIGNQDLSFGAAYWPYLQTQLPLPGGGRVILPPSPAVAGKMIKTDQTKGVWKAPAGISLSSVIAPVEAISQSEISDMTTHSSGLSINPIKAFSGKGILIWGARTLAGNDYEWRYVSVRRFANLLERQIRSLTAFAQNKPNDANTWREIKSVLSSHLQDLFRRGAFPASKVSDAYFVKVGLGETMTANDVNQGRIIIQVGFAPLKPAEFVVLEVEWRW